MRPRRGQELSDRRRRTSQTRRIGAGGLAVSKGPVGLGDESTGSLLIPESLDSCQGCFLASKEGSPLSALGSSSFHAFVWTEARGFVELSESRVDRASRSQWRIGTRHTAASPSAAT